MSFLAHSVSLKKEKYRWFHISWLFTQSRESGVNRWHDRNVEEALFECLDSQWGHIISTHCTGDVSTVCFTLTMNYTMKTLFVATREFLLSDLGFTVKQVKLLMSSLCCNWVHTRTYRRTTTLTAHSVQAFSSSDHQISSCRRTAPSGSRG